MNTPLAGLRIAVTRPRGQAENLARRIEEAGGLPLLFPLLEIEPILDGASLRALVSRLAEFDLAIFISPNAVRYGLQAIRAQGALPPALKIAAVGQGSANALREAGVADVIAPCDKSDSEALLALPELQAVKGLKTVIFRGEGGRELLADTLTVRGASVEYAECYRRKRPQGGADALLAAHPDAITLTSSEAVMCLWEMLDAAGRTKLSAVPLFVIHTRIGAVAQKLGFLHVVETQGGDDGLIDGLVAWAKRNPDK
jgi:uroporphyrinogen-III synthase